MSDKELADVMRERDEARAALADCEADFDSVNQSLGEARKALATSQALNEKKSVAILVALRQRDEARVQVAVMRSLLDEIDALADGPAFVNDTIRRTIRLRAPAPDAARVLDALAKAEAKLRDAKSWLACCRSCGHDTAAREVRLDETLAAIQALGLQGKP